ncbi:MAG: DUF6690 family protein [Pirellulales bacterium]
MFKRFFVMSFLVGSVAVPYALSTSKSWMSSAQSFFSGSGESKPAAGPAAKAPTNASSQATGGTTGSVVPEFQMAPAKAKDIEGAPAQQLTEVLRFDGSPAWVMQRWPRVTTGLSHPELQGYRVPLVTGTGVDDLAGSLTYYFDQQQQVKFLTFHGVTGDPRKIVSLVVQRYGFAPEPTDDPSLSLYLVKWHGKPISELRVRTARVLRHDQPHQRFQVDLAMKRP